MPITLTETEIQTVAAMEAQARDGQIGYWQIYDWLANNLYQTNVGPRCQVSLLP